MDLEPPLSKQCLSSEKDSYLVEAATVCKSDLSSVHFGTRLSDSAPFAFKTIPNKTLADREIQTLASLSAQPHVVHPVDSFTDPQGQSVLVLPKLASLDVNHQDLKNVAKIMRGILRGLEGIHAMGVVHLDVTPGNVMLDEHGDAVLIDFGLASKLSDGEMLPVRGTPGYLAPELIAGKAHDAKVDIWSAGILFGQMLEPHVPDCQLYSLGCKYARHDIHRSVVAHLLHFKQIRDSLGGFYPDIVYQAVDLLLCMLVEDPADRIACTAALNHPFLKAVESEFAGTELTAMQQRALTFSYYHAKSDMSEEDDDGYYSCSPCSFPVPSDHYAYPTLYEEDDYLSVPYH
ncbi:uncharacterized protein VTP21DRAFT_2475 [Calcarisporiella thermophila]|uniref:uncharacterized protein n=1 Tax=Calcarisporiella thermophila TaxID=911321 RepID=UPI00374421D2